MFARARYVVTAFLLLFFSVSAGLAQQYGPQQERRAFAQQIGRASCRERMSLVV